jgi:NADPH-dependent curcumin reductase CurA
MTQPSSREIRLASRPRGLPTPENITLARTTLPALTDEHVLVRNLYFSVDPYMRGRMNDVKSYAPGFELGQPLTGRAVGEVLETRSSHFKVGETVLSMYGFRESFVAPAAELYRLNPEFQPPSVYLGVLGATGMTAWAGLNLVDVKAGETIFISGAAGAVGSAAGQLAKLRNCRVIGSAGSAEKVKFAEQQSGFDVAFDYKSGKVSELLQRAAPDGIDVYFDNVGGETLEAALTHLRPHGRIIGCGSISRYNETAPSPGPTNLMNIVTKRLTWKGFIVSDFLHQRAQFEREVGRYYLSGSLKNHETQVSGLEQAIPAFIGLFHGQNTGKMVVKLTNS